MRGHAEIAGGGIAGLSLGAMLARQGWTVTVHERSPEVREIGAGIYIKNNSIEVLEELGIYARLVRRGSELERALVLDPQGRVVHERLLAPRARVLVLPRQSLIEELRDAALASGVEILTGSAAQGATPEGELLLEDGRRRRADLVVAADGARSKVRDSLQVGARHRVLPTTINRYLIPSREIAPDGITREHWSGYRRIGITPSGDAATYVYQVCPTADAAATRLPNDVAVWTAAFPRLRREIKVFAASRPSQYQYSVVHCPVWSRGRVAFVGDAAHGLPPTLGQGAGLTIMNARALAGLLTEAKEIPATLARWEAELRFISDATQRWALRYDWFTRQWPRSLGMLRPAVVWAFRNFPALNERMRMADRGLRQTGLRLPTLPAPT